MKKSSLKKSGIEAILEILSIRDDDLEIIGKFQLLRRDKLMGSLEAHIRDIYNYKALTKKPLDEEGARELFRKYDFPEPEFKYLAEGRIAVEFAINHSRRYSLWLYYSE